MEALERRGLCGKQDLFDIIAEFGRKNPRTRFPERAFPDPYLLSGMGNKIFDHMLDLLNGNGITSQQPLKLPEWPDQIIEIGQ